MLEGKLQNWKLSRKSFLGLLTVSVYPLLYVPIRSLLGEGLALFAMLPIVPIFPFGWVGAELAGTLAPTKELHLVFYGTGFSLGIFATSYLCLVNWRFHRAKKKNA